MEKFDLQDEEYRFPYHYLVSFEKDAPSINKKLGWGIEYLTYINFVKEKILKINPKSLLDIGCGDGYLINSLEYNKEKKFLGIDLSERAIKFANAFSNGYEFKKFDLFDIKEKFDVVTLIEVIEHIPDDFLDQFINEACEKVDNNGYLIVSVPTNVEPVQKKHYRHYDEQMLSSHVKRTDFKIIDEIRLYRKSLILRNLEKLFMTSRSKSLRKFFWKLHKKFFYYANVEDGTHLIRIYKRVS